MKDTTPNTVVKTDYATLKAEFSEFRKASEKREADLEKRIVWLETQFTSRGVHPADATFDTAVVEGHGVPKDR